MTTMTINLATGGFAHNPQYAAGRADAYDDSKTLTPDAMAARAALYAEYGDLLFAMGYADRVLEYRRETAAVAAAETELAHTDLTTAAR